jgi:hypothetical protein
MVDPLVMTMQAVPREEDTGLVYIAPDEEWDRCPYGFTDTVRKEGEVLFCSLLFTRACGQLAELLREAGRDSDALSWEREGSRCAESVRRVFWDQEIGLFRAATLRCREHDIWGSAFAAYLGVADARQSSAIARYFRTNYPGLVQQGQIRHLPEGVYWETACERDQYQNGAHWATPTGWFVYALDPADQTLADQTVVDMVDHFRRHGACEWIFGDTRRLPEYLASAALPLAGIRAMLERRRNRGEQP